MAYQPRGRPHHKHEDTPLLAGSDTEDEIGGLPQPNGFNTSRIPCIIQDVTHEVREAAQAKSFIYPTPSYMTTLANRVMYVPHMFAPAPIDCRNTRVYGRNRCVSRDVV